MNIKSNTLALLAACNLAVLVVGAILSTSGCSSDPATGKLHWDGPKAGRIAAAIGNNLVNDAGQVALAELSGITQAAVNGDLNSSNFQQGAADYAWKSISTINFAGDLQNILAAAKADPTVSAAAAKAYVAIAPQTPAQRDIAVNAIAATISASAAPNLAPGLKNVVLISR